MGNELLITVDGKRHIAGSFDDISPEMIKKIDVLKDLDKVKALGHGVDFKGAIVITTKKRVITDRTFRRLRQTGSTIGDYRHPP